MMPVPVVAGKAGCFQRKHGSCLAVANCRQQPSEPGALAVAAAGDAQVIIYHHHLAEPELTGTLL